MNKLFTIIALSLIVAPVFGAQTLTCISDSAFTHCNLSQADRRDITLTNVVSGNCSGTNDWGVDSTGVWVDKGCGATFE
ncbi:MAG: DUF3011 domain-containing protein, partial [Gammaproteobacteria bacterium]